MKQTIGVIATAAALATFAYSVSAQPDPRSSIDAANRKFETLFNKGDAAGIANLYTADGEAFPPNTEVARGKDALQKLWQGVIDAGVSSAKLTTRDVESSGNLAYESGTYEMVGKDGASLDRGKYVVVWKRVQGQWLLHRDIWNSSAPAKP